MNEVIKVLKSYYYKQLDEDISDVFNGSLLDNKVQEAALRVVLFVGVVVSTALLPFNFIAIPGTLGLSFALNMIAFAGFTYGLYKVLESQKSFVQKLAENPVNTIKQLVDNT